MKELFEKVYINTDDDLPKLQGRYIFHDKVMGGMQEFMCPNNNPFVVSHLRDECDWYLKPVEMPTEGKIQKKNLIAQEKGYQNWDEMVNFFIDHNSSVNVAVLISSCYEELIAALKVAEATKEMYPKEFVRWISNEKTYESLHKSFEYWKQNIQGK